MFPGIIDSLRTLFRSRSWFYRLLRIGILAGIGWWGLQAVGVFAVADVSVALDPLRRRPPMARWEASSARDLDRLVRGLSRSLPDRYMGLLARYLREAGEGAPGHSLTAPCKVVRRGFARRPRLLQIERRAGPKTGAGFHLRAQLRVTPDGTAEGEAGWLEMGGGTYARRTMVGRVEDAQAGSRIALRLVGRDGETAIRAPDGNSLLGFALAWDEGLADSATRFDATGTLSIAGDFRPVASTLERLAAGASAIARRALRRRQAVRLAIRRARCPARVSML